MKSILVTLLFLTAEYCMGQTFKSEFEKLQGEYIIINDFYDNIDYSKNNYPFVYDQNKFKISDSYNLKISVNDSVVKHMEKYLKLKELFPYKIGDTSIWFSFNPFGPTSSYPIGDNWGLGLNHFPIFLRIDYNNSKLALYMPKHGKEWNKDNFKYQWFNYEFLNENTLKLTRNSGGKNKTVILKKK